MILITLKTIGLSQRQLLQLQFLRDRCKNKLLSFCITKTAETQFGFRNNFSTKIALLYCTELFRLAVDINSIVTAALRYLSKTFDSIERNILKEKLISVNFSENAVELLIDFISNRRQQTIVNNVKIDWIKLYQGLPQGTVLGSFIFNLYINELSKNIPSNCKISQCADYTHLYTEQKDLKQCFQKHEKSCTSANQYVKNYSLNLMLKKLN